MYITYHPRLIMGFHMEAGADHLLVKCTGSGAGIPTGSTNPAPRAYQMYDGLITSDHFIKRLFQVVLSTRSQVEVRGHWVTQ